MMKMNNQNPPPAVRLKYQKGDLILKEGDFGISVYKIISGSVQVFTQSGDHDITLCLLEQGEIFGELTFFSKDIQTRTASARAIEPVELEVWHPHSLSGEYEAMPIVIKHMTYELLNRSIRMYKLIRQMSIVDDHNAETTESTGEKEASGRLYYRKEVSLPCTYRPVDSSPKTRLNGLIKNISLSGANLEVKRINTTNFSHDSGEEFYVDLTMPNGKEIHLTSRVMAMRDPKIPGMISFGMIFTDMREGSKKELGFFLMP